MAGKKRPSSSICYLRDDERLREAILARLSSKGMSRLQLAERVGLQPSLISNYLNGKRPYMSQWDLIRVAKYLDLKVELTVTIDHDNL